MLLKKGGNCWLKKWKFIFYMLEMIIMVPIIMPFHSPISLWLKWLCQWFCFTQSTNWVGASRKVVAGTKEIWKKIQCRLRPAQCMGSPMQCARLYGAKIDGDEEVNWYEHQKSQHCWPSTTTTKSSTAWRTSYNCKSDIESPLDLWTVSKRFRTNCYKGSKSNFSKKRDEGQGLHRFRNILRVGRFTPPPSTLLCQIKAPRDRIFFGIFTSFPLITKFTSDYYLKEMERRKFLNEKESHFCKLLDIVFAFFFPSAFPSSFMTRHGLSLRTHRIVNIVLHIANRLVCWHGSLHRSLQDHHHHHNDEYHRHQHHHHHH